MASSPLAPCAALSRGFQTDTLRPRTCKHSSSRRTVSWTRRPGPRHPSGIYAHLFYARPKDLAQQRNNKRLLARAGRAVEECVRAITVGNLHVGPRPAIRPCYALYKNQSHVTQQGAPASSGFRRYLCARSACRACAADAAQAKHGSMLVCGTYSPITRDVRKQVKRLTLSIQSITQTVGSYLPAQRVTDSCVMLMLLVWCSVPLVSR